MYASSPRAHGKPSLHRHAPRRPGFAATPTTGPRSKRFVNSELTSELPASPIARPPPTPWYFERELPAHVVGRLPEHAMRCGVGEGMLHEVELLRKQVRLLLNVNQGLAQENVRLRQMQSQYAQHAEDVSRHLSDIERGDPVVATASLPYDEEKMRADDEATQHHE